jgi:hypothetical protein
MTMRVVTTSLLGLLLLLGPAVGATNAQESPGAVAQAGPVANDTPSQAYLRFHSALLKATSMEQVTPFWSAELLSEFSMAPPDQKASTLGLMKRMASMTMEVSVVKESTSGDRARLSLGAVNAQHQTVAGTVELTREKGLWRIVESEQWEGSR